MPYQKRKITLLGGGKSCVRITMKTTSNVFFLVHTKRETTKKKGVWVAIGGTARITITAAMKIK